VTRVWLDQKNRCAPLAFGGWDRKLFSTLPEDLKIKENQEGWISPRTRAKATVGSDLGHARPARWLAPTLWRHRHS
jgi:hypothetical protein